MKTEKKVVIVTGPPGNGRDDILLEMKEKTSFNYYHMFKYIVEEARIRGTNLTKINILDFYDSQPDKMDQFHKTAVAKIAAEIEKHGSMNIVSTPVHFEWKGSRARSGLHEEDIKILNPDQFVIIFDDILRVKERLRTDIQWREHMFTLGEIANWRREEIAKVYELASIFMPRRDVQLVAYENGPDFLKEVIYSRGKDKVYLSHPITGEGPEFFENITRFGDSISNYYIVFDPYVIKDWDIVETWRDMVNSALEKGEPRPSKLIFTTKYREGEMEQEIDALELEAGIKNLRFQIIDNDYKVIENSNLVVVYHSRASISAGVMCEMVYAKALGKMVYVYYPYEPSPFFEWYATRIFTDENDLRDFLIKESKLTGQTPLDIYSSSPPRGSN